jgi:hypothetical protein
VLVLGTLDDDVEAWLAAGQALGRVLLMATARGVAASPMTPPLEIADTRRRLAVEFGVVGHPLRLGYTGDDDAASTPRQAVEDILVERDAQ